MKPNGRRRWRKWASKGLDIVSGFTARGINHPQYWNRWRRHRNAVEVTGPLPPLPPREFSPRSLVGMTMGARKRAAWRDVFVAPDGRADISSLNASHEMLFSFWRGELAKYRIGQRLRACPGCFDCGSECWGCHEPHEPEDERCGETGLIRAGRLRPDKRIRPCTRPC